MASISSDQHDRADAVQALQGPQEADSSVLAEDDFSATSLRFRALIDGRRVAYEGDNEEKATDIVRTARLLGHTASVERALTTWEPHG